MRRINECFDSDEVEERNIVDHPWDEFGHETGFQDPSVALANLLCHGLPVTINEQGNNN